ncbi:hypothetical protein KR093_007760, partial [Drosophila rubida]
QQQQPRPGQRVLFMTRRPDQRLPEEEQITIVVVDEDTLRLFIRKVYLVAMIFILATSVTWLAISGAEFPFYPTIPVRYFFWLVPILPLLILFSCFPQIRYIFPWNWLITVLIVILFTFAGACIMDQFHVLNVFIGLGCIIMVLAIFYACGAFCPVAALPGLIAMSCMTCLLFIALIVLMIVLIFIRHPALGLSLGILFMVLTVTMILFHSQYIHGRLQIVPLFDGLYCSLLIYIHFTALCIAAKFIVDYMENT